MSLRCLIYSKMFNLVACASWIALSLHLGCLEVERCPLLCWIRLAVDSTGHERHLVVVWFLFWIKSKYFIRVMRHRLVKFEVTSISALSGYHLLLFVP